MERTYPKILAIIPCYNEAESIGKLLDEFSALDFPCDTLVIDDGSTDDSYTIASRISPVIKLEGNCGLATCIKFGLRFAIKHNYDYCIQIDGDAQHIPGEIARFFEAMASASPNILIGSRYYGRISACSGGARRAAGLLFSFQLYLLFRQWLYDPLSGMRMMDRMAMNYFAEYLDTQSLDTVIIPQAFHAGFSVGEVPVNMRPRISGKSYVGGLKGLRFMFRLMYKTLLLRFYHT